MSALGIQVRLEALRFRVEGLGFRACQVQLVFFCFDSCCNSIGVEGFHADCLPLSEQLEV